MISDSIIYEVAVLRLRQRRLLKMLDEKNVLQWNGAIESDDPELKTIYEEIRMNWMEDLKKLMPAQPITPTDE